jgi:4-nitrophenyl phosphatase
MTSADVRAVVLDMDGVLYLANTPRPGARELLAFLRQRGVPYLFLTNNTTRTPEEYATHLADLGLEQHPSPDRFITSGEVTVRWLRRNLRATARILVVGESALRKMIAAQGFELVEGDASGVDAVVVSIDRTFNYDKLKDAALAIRNGARFIGTNPDVTHPTPEGLFPGTGSILAAVEAASGVEPLLMGKPYRPPFQEALRSLGMPSENTIMIGDRLETDIVGAAEAGMRTALVLGGASSKADLQTSRTKPDLVFGDIRALLSRFRTAWRS